MTSGRLVLSKGKYYAVMYWQDPLTHTRIERWIGLKLGEKGNAKKAKAMLDELKRNFDPKDIVRTNVTLLKLGLNPLTDDGKRMKKSDVAKKVMEVATSDIPVQIAQNLQNGMILFSDFLKVWLERLKPTVRAVTYTGYHYSIYNVIAPYFQKHRIFLQDISPEDIETFYQKMLLTRNSNTVIRYHANIRKALQYAFKKGYILNNPADRVDRPKKSVYVHSYYNKDEIEELLKKVKGTELEYPVTMAAIYGLRKEEVLGLKWDAIDFQYKQLTIKHTVTEAIVNGKRVEIEADTTKTKKSFRTLPFDPGGVVENLLLEMKQNQENWKQLFGRSYDTKDEAYVFLRPNGQRYKTNWITMAFSDFLKKNNMRKIRFHDLRHTCATMLRHTGVPMEDIQKFLGHSTITTTEGIYAHFDDSQHKSTIMKLSDYLSNKTKDDENGNVVKTKKNKEVEK